jgi:hypothetical protein
MHHKLPLIKVGDQVFDREGGEEFGAVRAVAPNGQPEIVVYVENGGDYTVGLEAVTAVHDGKVVLQASALPPEMRLAIARAHGREQY